MVAIFQPDKLYISEIGNQYSTIFPKFKNRAGMPTLVSQ